MLRAIGGVIVGYIAMSIVFFLLFTGVYLVLGVDRTFQPNTYMVSTVWMIFNLVICVVGSFVGGVVCAAISKSARAGMVLAVIVLVVSFLACFGHLTGDNTPKPRSGDVSNLQAMQNAQMPTFMYVLTPILSAAGILLGSRKKLGSTDLVAQP